MLRLLKTLEVREPQMAAYLRVTQPTVNRLANGQEETGPVSLLLDQIEAAIDETGADAARAVVLRITSPSPATSGPDPVSRDGLDVAAETHDQALPSGV